jgi:aldose 1-epimerase
VLSAAQKDGPNSLHGGHAGFGNGLFKGAEGVERNGREALRSTYLSPDGEEGYAGTIALRIWYTASQERETGLVKVCLEAEYEAELVDNSRGHYEAQVRGLAPSRQ